MFWHEQDIGKLTRFLIKYCTKETSAPINNCTAVDVAILIIQKYLLTQVREDLLKEDKSKRTLQDDHPDLFFGDTQHKLEYMKQSEKEEYQMSQWIEFKDGQYPRKGEIIAVKGTGEPEIYPYLLRAEGSHEFYELRSSGSKLAFRGLTHWKLIEGPY